MEQWIHKGIAATHKQSPGIASQLRLVLRERCEQEKLAAKLPNFRHHCGRARKQMERTRLVMARGPHPTPLLTHGLTHRRISTMPAKAINTRRVSVQLPTYLSRRVERTARLTKCNVSEVVASALATSLPPLPDELPPAVAEELAGWMMLDDEALRAIAEAFLSQTQQRRFTALLRKHETKQLSTPERREWEELQQEYLRVSEQSESTVFIGSTSKARTT